MQTFFTTPRLRLRRFELADLDALATLSAMQDTSRYVGDGSPLSRTETARWIDNSRANVARFGYGTGAVIDRHSDALIGWGGVGRPDDGQEEIIYGLAPEAWGRGLGTELLEGMLGWLRDLGRIRVRATVHPDNNASIAMLERQGFRCHDSAYQGDAHCHLYILERT